jgi:hypothetical protein
MVVRRSIVGTTGAVARSGFTQRKPRMDKPYLGEADYQADLEDKKEDPGDYTTQLLRLRALTGHLGALHEAQVLQIRLWPFAVDPLILDNGVEAKIDINGQKISYLWKAKRPAKWKPDTPYRLRLKALKEAIKLMLGEVWSFNIKLNGKAIFSKEGNGKPRRNRTKKPPSNRRQRS